MIERAEQPQHVIAFGDLPQPRPGTLADHRDLIQLLGRRRGGGRREP